ncbi:cysteine synthase A [Pseudobutyrivibrio sp. AR14]|uniref:PLP-dependent cysteine synthase family protein n=1 Tax=Pseudobutyrivibrio sp. AR14 TaxID=1520804 RepID=UPI00088819F2|nr:PLP-dependent cysteine synthase family protein [Pseudobutyrivibrio sp. AR14]SCX82909.1 cysteine synthase A [Pseudobutyrivibrio sp. AR14]
MTILKDIGKTPVVKLENPYGDGFAEVYVKMEEFNPGGSIKSRVGFQMINDAEVNGLIKKGDTLIEATGGNTGVGLAIASSIKGYNLILVVPDNYSEKKIAMLKEYGAKVVLADHNLGNDCHIQVAEQLMKENPEYINLNQFKNESNPKAHYLYTAEEILNQVGKKIDVFVSVIGSGGTITGVSRKLKERNGDIRIVGVQPKGCDIIHNKYVRHKIQAIAVGKVGTFFDESLIDDMADVTYEEVQEIRKYLSEKQGIFVGLSAGANILAAFNEAKKYDSSKVIVTMAPDGGISYL